ncbi:hypothetical protein QP028_09500 [Corynebacterium suedekumii]|nr:hypothetical protein QP028_09500 [Corynebacterium suedekumii]
MARPAPLADVTDEVEFGERDDVGRIHVGMVASTTTIAASLAVSLPRGPALQRHRPRAGRIRPGHQHLPHRRARRGLRQPLPHPRPAAPRRRLRRPGEPRPPAA